MQSNSSADIQPVETELGKDEYGEFLAHWNADNLPFHGDDDYKNYAWKSWCACLGRNQAKINELEKKLKAQEKLQTNCMIDQTWFMKGTSVACLIKYAENVYKAEAVAQNSKIEFGTDDNEHWFAHDVPFFGRVQISWFKDDQEWDIHFNECWQGPFNSKSRCIQHLEECIQEKREEQAIGGSHE